MFAHSKEILIVSPSFESSTLTNIGFHARTNWWNVHNLNEIQKFNTGIWLSENVFQAIEGLVHNQTAIKHLPSVISVCHDKAFNTDW